MQDILSLHNLTLTVDIGTDRWDRPRPQPVLISLHTHTDLDRVAAHDDLTDSVSYSDIVNAVLALQDPAHMFEDLVGLAEAAAAIVLEPPFHRVTAVRVVAEAPKLLLQAQGLGVDITRPGTTPPSSPDKMYIKDLTLSVLVGENPIERLRKQLVIITITFHCLQNAFPHAEVVQQLTQHIEGTRYRTLEAFATAIARLACFIDGMDVVTVNAQKPSAITFGQSSGAEITRDRAFFEKRPERFAF